MSIENNNSSMGEYDTIVGVHNKNVLESETKGNEQVLLGGAENVSEYDTIVGVKERNNLLAQDAYVRDDIKDAVNYTEYDTIIGIKERENVTDNGQASFSEYDTIVGVKEREITQDDQATIAIEAMDSPLYDTVQGVKPVTASTTAIEMDSQLYDTVQGVRPVTALMTPMVTEENYYDTIRGIKSIIGKASEEAEYDTIIEESSVRKATKIINKQDTVNTVELRPKKIEQEPEVEYDLVTKKTTDLNIMLTPQKRSFKCNIL